MALLIDTFFELKGIPLDDDTVDGHPALIEAINAALSTGKALDLQGHAIYVKTPVVVDGGGHLTIVADRGGIFGRDLGNAPVARFARLESLTLRDLSFGAAGDESTPHHASRALEIERIPKGRLLVQRVLASNGSDCAMHIASCRAARLEGCQARLSPTGFILLGCHRTLLHDCAAHDCKEVGLYVRGRSGQGRPHHGGVVISHFRSEHNGRGIVIDDGVLPAHDVPRAQSSGTSIRDSWFEGGTGDCITVSSTNVTVETTYLSTGGKHAVVFHRPGGRVIANELAGIGTNIALAYTGTNVPFHLANHRVATGTEVDVPTQV